MLRWAITLVAVWGGGALLIFALMGDPTQPPATTPASSAASSAPAQAQAGGAQTRAVTNSQVYRADRQGHVILNGTVNGSDVRFLVDTGATYVALTLADAKAAGFERSDLVFNARAATANGVSRAATVTLREIRIGQFSIYDVPAFVEERLPISLLGQSFLTRLDGYEMRDGVLTLNWN